MDEATGTPGGLYDHALFEEGRGHVLVYRPAADPPREGRVRPVTLPAVELAVTSHVGEHDDIDVTYGELGAWVVTNALAVAGPVREHSLVGRATRPTRRPGGPRSAGRFSAWPHADGLIGRPWVHPPTDALPGSADPSGSGGSRGGQDWWVLVMLLLLAGR